LRFLLGPASAFLGVFATTLFVGLDDSGGLLWFSNGILLAYLLLVPRWRWRPYLVCGFAAMFAAGVAVHPGRWRSCIVLSLLNLLEVLVAALLLRKRSAQLPRFSDQRYLLRFGAYAVLLAPSTAALLFTLIFSLWKHLPPGHAFSAWLTCDGLGIAVVTPACVALIHSGLKFSGNWRSHWFCPVVLVGVTYFSFSQVRVPIIFLIYPLVAMVLFRFGLSWATLSTLLVAAIGGWFTVHGEGPFSKIATISPIGSSVLLQLFLASGTFMMYAASSVMDMLRSTERRLREIVYLHELVTENSRDVIILADLDGRRSYVSASASHMGNWGREELLGIKSLELVHPDDRAMAERLIRNIRAGGEGDLLECRVQNKNGIYIWVEANIRPVRDPVTGVAIGILNIVRDISERKRAERELKKAYAAVEALAITDPLTHLANRRRFDQCMTTEWRRGMRERMPLSMLVLDCDWFKSFNDTYGHPRGDSCLKQIAEAVLDVATRPGDLVARIGGEEFAVILPNTPADGAIQVANQICDALRRRRLPHNTNPTGFVTISIGCATIVPSLGQHATVLMQHADEALYAAKHAGRNQVFSADLHIQKIAALEAG
jgi:diguanylate cyclase (GGDEF)-like protein/PAS domain S-box-containing protein